MNKIEITFKCPCCETVYNIEFVDNWLVMYDRKKEIGRIRLPRFNENPEFLSQEKGQNNE